MTTVISISIYDDASLRRHTLLHERHCFSHYDGSLCFYTCVFTTVCIVISCLFCSGVAHTKSKLLCVHTQESHRHLQVMSGPRLL